jgi:hypothetical protein
MSKQRACDQLHAFSIRLTCRYVTRYFHDKTEYWAEENFYCAFYDGVPYAKTVEPTHASTHYRHRFIGRGLCNAAGIDAHAGR